jgi:hypothetical protein
MAAGRPGGLWTGFGLLVVKGEVGRDESAVPGTRVTGLGAVAAVGRARCDDGQLSAPRLGGGQPAVTRASVADENTADG